MSSTDEVLRQSVLHALATDRQTAALSLRVGVLKGIVHLGGEAPSEALWNVAGAVAGNVPGVRGVVNRIEAPGAPDASRVISISVGGRERKPR